MREPVELSARKSFTPKQRLEILLASDGRCKICQEKIIGDFEIEHRVPIALGGTNDPSNLEAVHPQPCHSGKTKADVKSIAKAKRLERKANPETRKAPTMKGRGFQTALTRGFNGKVRPRG